MEEFPRDHIRQRWLDPPMDEPLPYFYKPLTAEQEAAIDADNEAFGKEIEAQGADGLPAKTEVGG